MRYISTRGKVRNLSFEDAVMMGLADDGGLLIPESIPNAQDQLASWRSLNFQELSYHIMALFIEGEIPQTELKDLVERSYASFENTEITF